MIGMAFHAAAAVLFASWCNVALRLFRRRGARLNTAAPPGSVVYIF